jgi:hypothetical protein
MLAAILLYRPIFQAMHDIANPVTKTKITERTSLKTPDEHGMRPSVTQALFTDGSMVTTTMVHNFNEPGTPPKVTYQVNLGESGKWKMIALVAVMVLFVTMVYGPIAAFLVELFPTRIRYTSMSLPYHIGNGVFGGMVPFIATLITTLPGSDHLSGLWYPIGVAAASLIIGSLYLSNKIDKDVTD